MLTLPLPLLLLLLLRGCQQPGNFVRCRFMSNAALQKKTVLSCSLDVTPWQRKRGHLFPLQPASCQEERWDYLDGVSSQTISALVTRLQSSSVVILQVHDGLAVKQPQAHGSLSCARQQQPAGAHMAAEGTPPILFSQPTVPTPIPIQAGLGDGTTSSLAHCLQLPGDPSYPGQ